MSWRIRITGRLGDLDFDVDIDTEEDRLVIVGPNGAGKTSTLRAVAGARLPLSVDVRLDGVPFDVLPERRRVGYVPQGFGLFGHLTVAQNVAFGADERSTAQAIERFDLGALRDRYPRRLSGGEKQRTALARAMACQPRCLLLDEPLAALDIRRRRATREALVADLAREGLPAIVVTHDKHDVVAFGGQIIGLEAGRVATDSAFLSELLG